MHAGGNLIKSLQVIIVCLFCAVNYKPYLKMLNNESHDIFAEAPLSSSPYSGVWMEVDIILAELFTKKVAFFGKSLY